MTPAQNEVNANAGPTPRPFPNVYTSPQPVLKVGEYRFRNTNLDVCCELQSGSPFWLVCGFGKSEAEALSAARLELARLREANGLDADGSEKVKTQFN